MRLDRALAIGQGAYFAATGLWSLVDIDSFQAVTGPKTDIWLVRTVGALVLVIGGVLMLAARREEVSREMVALAVGSALALAAIDAWYVARGTISPIYLADAAAEVAIAGGWLAATLGPAKARSAMISR